MNKHLRHSLSILGILTIVACGSRDENPEIKALPESFSLVFPSNNSVCQEGDLIADQPRKLGVIMKWKKSINATSYKLSLTNMATGTEEVDLKSSNTQANVVLTKATLYQWKITAVNNNGEKESTQWSFYTKGDGIGNHVPYPAYDFSFAIQATNNLLAVSWKATDEDQDPLSYNVKVFENDNEISTYSELLDKSLSVEDITVGSTYKLLVTVKDGVSDTTTESPTFTYN